MGATITTLTTALIEKRGRAAEPMYGVPEKITIDQSCANSAADSSRFGVLESSSPTSKLVARSRLGRRIAPKPQVCPRHSSSTVWLFDRRVSDVISFGQTPLTRQSHQGLLAFLECLPGEKNERTPGQRLQENIQKV
jgi:hypothetical protein